MFLPITYENKITSIVDFNILEETPKYRTSEY